MHNIEINIGNACNNKCRFCMIEYEDKRCFIAFNLIKKEVIKARRQAYDSIGFLGGEFTLHPDLLKIVKLCKILGYKTIHIISNGRRFADSELLSDLIKNGVNRFSVSVHSHDQKVDDYLTQSRGGFKQKLQGIKNLIKFRKTGKIRNSLSINIVINNLNYKEIVKTLNYFHGLGIEDFRLNFIWLHGRAQRYSELYLKFSDFVPYIKDIISAAKEHKYNFSFEGIPACIINSDEALNYLGELKDQATQVVAYNNPKQLRESFNWQSRKANEFKIKNDNCQLCHWNSICDGIWRDYITIYGWDEFQPKEKNN